MKLAKYWAKGEIDRMNHDPSTGAPCKFFCWGWSNESVEQAREVGRQHARAAAALIDAGKRPDHYTYGDKAFREQILDEWKLPDGSTYAAITINSYGCDIINTTNTMFVDVDISQPALRVREEKTATDRLAKVLNGADHLGAHVYRTAGGLRYIMARPDADPHDPAVLELMGRLGADPLYIILCRVQECFRARLTPKPWRCGVDPLRAKYPWEGTDVESRVRHWREKYARASTQYAVCEYLGYQGPDVRLTEEAGRVIEYHDRLTRARSGLKLA